MCVSTCVFAFDKMSVYQFADLLMQISDTFDQKFQPPDKSLTSHETSTSICPLKALLRFSLQARAVRLYSAWRRKSTRLSSDLARFEPQMLVSLLHSFLQAGGLPKLRSA